MQDPIILYICRFNMSSLSNNWSLIVESVFVLYAFHKPSSQYNILNMALLMNSTIYTDILFHKSLVLYKIALDLDMFPFNLLYMWLPTKFMSYNYISYALLV